MLAQRSAVFAAAVAATVVATLADAATPRPGALDPSWGSGGTVATPLLYGRQVSLELVGVALLPDGKLVAEAEHVLEVGVQDFVARYTTDGRPDRTFGRDGLVVLPKGRGGPLAPLPDGKVLAGNTLLNADGSLDASFRPPSTPAGPQTLRAILPLPNGRLLEASTVFRKNPKTALFGLFRLLANGKLDMSFGTHAGGTVTAVGNPGYGWTSPYGILAPRAIVRVPGGSVFVAGEAGVTATRGAFALLHYQADGKLDPAFGTQGVVLTTIGAGSAGASAILRLPNGRLLVAGYVQTGYGAGKIALARYTPDGKLDPVFGSGGTLVTQLFTAGRDFPLVNLAAAPGGRFVIGPQNGYTRIARIDGDGSPDPSFGTNGTIDPKIQWQSTAVQPDGRIVVGGIGSISGRLGIVIRRYLG